MAELRSESAIAAAEAGAGNAGVPTKIALDCADGSAAARWYKDYLGRCGEAGGLDYWKKQLATQSETAVLAAFTGAVDSALGNKAKSAYLDGLLCESGNSYVTNTDRCRKKTAAELASNACTDWTLSNGPCQPDGTFVKTIAASLPAGCAGGTPPALSGTCAYSAPGCKGTHPAEGNGVRLSGYTLVGMVGSVMNDTWKYEEPNLYSCIWSCEAGYARNGNAGCVKTQSQTTCTSWIYSPSSECQQNGIQNVTATNPTPAGCSGGTPKTTQACTYVPPVTKTCTGNLPSDMTGVRTSPYTDVVAGPQDPGDDWKYGVGSCTW